MAVGSSPNFTAFIFKLVFHPSPFLCSLYFELIVHIADILLNGKAVNIQNNWKLLPDKAIVMEHVDTENLDNYETGCNETSAMAKDFLRTFFCFTLQWH